jgi:RNA polymerase sigma-70 factor (ECF subfamily)
MASAPQGTNLEDLAIRIHAGDGAAEEDFFRKVEQRVRAFVVANSGDRDLAEELVQDVIWAVIRALRKGQVRQTDQIPAFLFSTARNLLHDKLRTRSREKLDQLSPDVEISRPAMEQREFERSHAARQAIYMLDPHERVVLLLSLVDGLSADEVAVRLRITPESVRQRKSRGIRKLAEILAKQSQTLRPGLLRSMDK